LGPDGDIFDDDGGRLIQEDPDAPEQWKRRWEAYKKDMGWNSDYDENEAPDDQPDWLTKQHIIKNTTSYEYDSDGNEKATPGDKWANDYHYLKDEKPPPGYVESSGASSSEFTEVYETWDPKVDKFKEKWEMINDEEKEEAMRLKRRMARRDKRMAEIREKNERELKEKGQDSWKEGHNDEAIK